MHLSKSPLGKFQNFAKTSLKSLSPAEGQLLQKFSVQGHSQWDSIVDPFLLVCVNRLGRPPDGDLYKHINLNVFIGTRDGQELTFNY